MKNLLPQERPVTIFVNEQAIVTLMATPAHLRELAIGYLKNTGRIDVLEQIGRLYACEDDERLMIEGETILQQESSAAFIASACGQAQPQGQALPSPLTVSATFFMAELQAAVSRLLRSNQRYRQTGGIHAAALISGAYFNCREDIGRHNAHDKVTGAAMEAGVDLTRAAILGTGRISSDMVIKAVHARIPVLASLSVPTDLAAGIAERHGICLIGRMTKEQPVIWTHPERINEKPA